ncbi:hypothetical protein HDK64DRAFT_311396 [Phyllosticta capitalensis]
MSSTDSASSSSADSTAMTSPNAGQAGQPGQADFAAVVRESSTMKSTIETLTTEVKNLKDAFNNLPIHNPQDSEFPDLDQYIQHQRDSEDDDEYEPTALDSAASTTEATPQPFTSVEGSFTSLLNNKRLKLSDTTRAPVATMGPSAVNSVAPSSYHNYNFNPYLQGHSGQPMPSPVPSFGTPGPPISYRVPSLPMAEANSREPGSHQLWRALHMDIILSSGAGA